MVKTYSAHEAKAKFSELLRHVRRGQRVIISYQGVEVAEMRPLQREPTTEQRVRDLESRGILRPAAREGGLAPLRRVPRGLERFLASRD